MKNLAVNKRATFDYAIDDTYEAGVVLLGHEVKAAKSGRVSLKGAFVTIKRRSDRPLPALILTNAHIPLYEKASRVLGYDPTRPRQLLLKRQEIARLIGKQKEEGLTLVPLRLYTKRSLIKLEFGIGRGKKKYDKRALIKKRETDRQIRTALKRKN
jgi:SsrA-binding protein